MEPYQHIINHKLVTDWFGHWTAFHDAEVLSMALDRGPLEDGAGPNLVVQLHAFEPTLEVDDFDYSRLVKHAIITLEFGGVEGITLDGLNRQNVLFQLDFAEAASEKEQPALDVRFCASFGVECAFRSTWARVKSVEPGKPSEGLYA